MSSRPSATGKRARQLFWRGVTASLGGVAMTSGLYPVLPSLGHLWVRRRKGVPAAISTTSLATEWATSAAGSLMRPLGLLGERLGQGTGRPIILIHGYMMSRSCFLLLARRLRGAGLGPIYGFEYWSLGTVRSAALRLGQCVEKICAQTGHSTVDLVGHSMGGLVARYYATIADGAERIDHLVTLGTPHGGAYISSLGLGRPQIELRPRTPFFARLEAATLPDTVRARVIWSRADALVWDEQQASWPGVQHSVYDDLGHVALLYSRRVAQEVVALVSEDDQRA